MRLRSKQKLAILYNIIQNDTYEEGCDSVLFKMKFCVCVCLLLTHIVQLRGPINHFQDFRFQDV